MQSRRRREFHLEHWLDAPVEFGGLELRADQRNPRRACELLESGWKTLSLGNENSRYRKREEELQNLPSFRRTQRREIRDLRFAENLKTARRKSFDVARQHQPRAGHFRIPDNPIVTCSRFDLLELQRAAQALEKRGDRYLRSRHSRSFSAFAFGVIARLPARGVQACRWPRGPM